MAIITSVVAIWPHKMSFLVRLIFVNIYIISVYSKRVDLAFITDSQFMYLDLYIQFRNYDFVLVCYNNTYCKSNSITNDAWDLLWQINFYTHMFNTIDKVQISNVDLLIYYTRNKTATQLWVAPPNDILLVLFQDYYITVYSYYISISPH